MTRVTSSMHALREPYGTLLLQQVLGRVRVMSPILVHACMHDHDMITRLDCGLGGGRDCLEGLTTRGRPLALLNNTSTCCGSSAPHHVRVTQLNSHWAFTLVAAATHINHSPAPQCRRLGGNSISHAAHMHAQNVLMRSEEHLEQQHVRSIQSNTPINRWRRL